MFLTRIFGFTNILESEMGLGSWCYSVFTLTLNVGNSENLENQKFIIVKSAKRNNPLLKKRILTEIVIVQCVGVSNKNLPSM